MKTYLPQANVTLMDAINRLSAIPLILLLGLLSSQNALALSVCKKNGATVYTKACLEEMQAQKENKATAAPSQTTAEVNPTAIATTLQTSATTTSTTAPIATPVTPVTPAPAKNTITSRQEPTAPLTKDTEPDENPKCHFYSLIEQIQSASKESFLACKPSLAQLNQQDDRKASKGRTLLHWAITVKQTEMASLLIQLGADITLLSRTDNGAQPIHLAAQNGLNELIKLLLNKGSPLESLDYFKRTPLHWAAEANQLSSSDQLLKAGANPNASDRIGKTPLMLSIGHSGPELVRLLLTAGANPQSTNFRGLTALHLAALHSPQALEVLIQQDIDLNPLNREGQNPLMLAASINPQRYWQNIKQLVEQGAKLNIIDRNGQTLVDYSLTNNHLPLFELLLSQGVDSDNIRIGQLKEKTTFIQTLRKQGRL